ncbi:MAG: SDR family NAD(P)-dependent oxidoreductase [Dehalococcoidia bacterium]
MDLGVKGKVALITGGSEGIGRATAHVLAAEGAKVAICSRGQEALDAAAAEIKAATGTDVLTISADVTKLEDIERAVASVSAKLGTPTLLVNNAGTSAAAPFPGVTDETWGYDLDLKLMAAIRVSRLVVPLMQEAGGGSIVNVTAINGKHPAASSMPTSVSRAAGIALSKGMSKDLASSNIRVNAVCIGLIKSRQISRAALARSGGKSAEEGYALMGANVPLGRVGESEEAANVIAFLLSDAASYITGVAVNIDGGMSSAT